MTKINPNNNNTIWLYKSARTDDIYDFFSGNLSEVMNRVNLFAADAEKLTECGCWNDANVKVISMPYEIGTEFTDHRGDMWEIKEASFGHYAMVQITNGAINSFRTIEEMDNALQSGALIVRTKSRISFKGVCVCESHDLFWFGCRCGHVVKT